MGNKPLLYTFLTILGLMLFGFTFVYNIYLAVVIYGVIIFCSIFCGIYFAFTMLFKDDSKESKKITKYDIFDKDYQVWLSDISINEAVSHRAGIYNEIERSKTN